MRVRWFGPTWGAPINEPGFEVAAPLGEFCLSCDEKIQEGERGLVLGCAGTLDEAFPMWIDGSSHSVCAYHIDCFLESILRPDYRSFEGYVDRTVKEERR